MEQTEHYGLKKPGAEDFYSVQDQNGNMDAIDAALDGLEKGKASLGTDGKVPAAQLPEMDYEAPIKDAPAKETPADADALALIDATDQKTKKLLWSRVKAVLKGWFDTLYAAVNHTHTAAQVGADPAGSAEAVDAKLTGHTGDKSNPHAVTAAQVSARPDTWVPAWGDVTGKPATFVPSAHTHTKSQISDFPTTMTPTAHTHGAGDISSGTLSADRLPTVPVSKGGTGATTAAAARSALGACTLVGPVNVTINTTWSGSGPWTKTVSVSGVTAADEHLGLYLAKITDDASRKLQEEAFNCITYCETVAGGITLTCREKKPTVSISAVLKGER